MARALLRVGWYGDERVDPGQLMRVDRELELALQPLCFPAAAEIRFRDHLHGSHVVGVPRGRYSPQSLCGLLSREMSRCIGRAGTRVEAQFQPVDPREPSVGRFCFRYLTGGSFPVLDLDLSRFLAERLGFERESYAGSTITSERVVAVPMPNGRIPAADYRVELSPHTQKLRLSCSASPLLSGRVSETESRGDTVVFDVLLGGEPFSHGYAEGTVLRVSAPNEGGTALAEVLRGEPNVAYSSANGSYSRANVSYPRTHPSA